MKQFPGDLRVGFFKVLIVRAFFVANINTQLILGILGVMSVYCIGCDSKGLF